MRWSKKLNTYFRTKTLEHVVRHFLHRRSFVESPRNICKENTVAERVVGPVYLGYRHRNSVGKGQQPNAVKRC